MIIFSTLLSVIAIITLIVIFKKRENLILKKSSTNEGLLKDELYRKNMYINLLKNEFIKINSEKEFAEIRVSSLSSQLNEQRNTKDLTDKELRVLIQLTHPDRSEKHTELNRKLIDLKGKMS